MEVADSMRFMYATVWWREEKCQIKLAGVTVTARHEIMQAKPRKTVQEC